MAEAGVWPGELVLDIGAGQGALAAHLIEQGARVMAVELHPARVRLLRERFAGMPVTVAHADAVSLRLPRRPFRVVASPPYAVSGPLLRLLLAPSSQLAAADLVLQRAVVRRYTQQRAPGAGRWGRWAGRQAQPGAGRRRPGAARRRSRRRSRRRWCPVRPEKPEYLATGDAQVQAVDGQRGSVPLGQALAPDDLRQGASLALRPHRHGGATTDDRKAGRAGRQRRDEPGLVLSTRAPRLAS